MLERSAQSMAQAREGESILIKTPHGVPQRVAIAGIVHDPGLAPAWQEREVYAYATRETLVMLGEAPELHELRVAFSPAPVAVHDAEARAEQLAKWLMRQGARILTAPTAASRSLRRHWTPS